MRPRVEVEIVLYWNSWRVIFCSLVILCILSTLVTRMMIIMISNR